MDAPLNFFFQFPIGQVFSRCRDPWLAHFWLSILVMDSFIPVDSMHEQKKRTKQGRKVGRPTNGKAIHISLVLIFLIPCYRGKMRFYVAVTLIWVGTCAIYYIIHKLEIKQYKNTLKLISVTKLIILFKDIQIEGPCMVQGEI